MPNADAHANHRRSPSRLAAGLLALGASLALVPAAAGVAHRAQPMASAASAKQLDETGTLRLTSKHGFTLNEKGSAHGTVTGTIYVHLTIVSSSRVTAEVNIYPHGGSLSGQASAAYSRGTSMAEFDGTISLGHGSGRYAGTHGTGLSFTGTIQKSNDAIVVHVRGTVTG